MSPEIENQNLEVLKNYILSISTICQQYCPRICQRVVKRLMFEVSLRDKTRNEEISRNTRICDVVGRIARLKWRWAGHVARKNVK